MSEIISSLKNDAHFIIDTGVLFLILTGVAVGLRIVSSLTFNIKLGIALAIFWVETGLDMFSEFIRFRDSNLANL